MEVQTTDNLPKMFGREKEKDLLQRCQDSNSAELVVVYGRRRVGKTFLVREFFHNRFDFYLTGAYQASRQVQLTNFALALEQMTGKPQPVPKDWVGAFEQLKAGLLKLRGKRKKIIFIDEIPWLDTRQSGFLSAFEHFWNAWGSAKDDLMLIVCGSATSWITNNLLGNKGGLFNRATCRIYLQQFTLRETEQYLKARGFRWTRYDIAECYMTMGGIPYYLRQLNPALSLTANIDELFFRPKGLLWDEFQHLYRTLFNQPENFELLVSCLSKKNYGLTRAEIVKETKLPDNGRLSEMLQELMDSDFIRSYQFFGNKKRQVVYQLSDFYTLFYFRFIKGKEGRDAHFWTNTLDHPSRRAWAGIAFEQLCMTNVSQLKKALGIAAVLSEQSSWFDRSPESAAQIDLLIDRRDNVINICEMKFCMAEFTITADYEKRLRQKMEAFRLATSTRKALHLVMVTSHGLKKNKYASIVQAQVTLNELFK